MKRLNIYVASSWRNAHQPGVVDVLRALGHEVYDFRNPPQRAGFGWEEIAANWQSWTTVEYREALKHPLARTGYASDIGALRACEACVLVLPCGRSANWELGYAMGAGKLGFVIQYTPQEPELMYAEAMIIGTKEELVQTFEIDDRLSTP